MPKVVIATPNTPAITKLDFFKRFTFSEKVAIETASETDPGVRVVMQGFSFANEINVKDPETISGMEYLVSMGLIPEHRKTEILDLSQTSPSEI